MSRRTSKLWLALLVVGVVQSPRALGWDENGHQIVAAIAWEDLTPEARKTVEDLLKEDADQSLTAASTWADRIKSDPGYNWADSLHYVNLAEGADAYDPQRDCASGDCVVAAIDRFTLVMRDPNAPLEKRREALKFVVHFVGDVHQPMHASRAADRGGNSIKVTFFDAHTDLHTLWDKQLFRHAQKAWDAYGAELRKAITDEQRTTWAASTPVEWATESWKLALGNAYVPMDSELGQAYYDKNLPVMEERFKAAGVRLAAVLNGTYKPQPPTASAPATPESDVKFVGSQDSEVYHYPGCGQAQRIKAENLVKYTEAPAGKRLHEGCDPAEPFDRTVTEFAGAGQEYTATHAYDIDFGQTFDPVVVAEIAVFIDTGELNYNKDACKAGHTEHCDDDLEFKDVWTWHRVEPNKTDAEAKPALVDQSTTQGHMDIGEQQWFSETRNAAYFEAAKQAIEDGKITVAVHPRGEDNYRVHSVNLVVRYK